MSSTTAHFGLTKAASNESYSLPVVNGNSDIIDTQMYNNQQSAAKIMVGATAQEDGESGRVPAPTSADRTKYLKGDGTWDTPSGGGGGSSTLAGLTDVSLTSPTDGQALVYDATNQEWVNGTVSGGGGSGFTETSLFTGGVSGDTTFALSDAITNYDYIAVYYRHSDGSTTYQDVKLYPSSLLYSLIGTSVNILGIANDAWYYYFTVTSTTQFAFAKKNAGWITDIVGLKYGSGGGSGLTATILSNTLWSSAGTYTLNDDYDNYDILEIYFCNPSAASSESDLITVMVDDVKSLMDSSKVLNLTGYGDRYVNCTFSADEFTITASNSGGVQKIVGYKAGGGSSEVKYSTTEHKVGTWIDGSDVYEQTIVLRENDTNNYTYIDSVFSQCLPANIDWIDIVSFYSKRNVGGYVDCMNNSSETNIVPNPSNQSIYYQTMHNASDVIVTIRYTKTGGNS